MPFSAEANVPSYLGSSIAEETIALLTGDPLSPVQVLARDSAFSLAARGMHAHQVGEALRADLVLAGTLRSLPSHFRLRAEMIRVADGTQIWVEDMLVPQARAAGLESELAHRLFVRLGTYDPFLSKPHRSLPAVQRNRVAAKPMSCSCGDITNGRPCSGIACRMASSICHAPSNSTRLSTPRTSTSQTHT